MEDRKAEEVTLDSSGNEDDEPSSGGSDAHDFEKRLIEEVKKRPFLFDHTNDGFKDLKKKEDAWGHVALAVGRDGDVTISKCQCRWKSLRDRYVRESRKIREGGGPKRRMWEMFKYLTFLEDVPRLYRGTTYVWTPTTKGRRAAARKPAAFIVPSSPPPPPPQPEVELEISSVGSCSTLSPLMHVIPQPQATIPTSAHPESMLSVHLTEKPISHTSPRKHFSVPHTITTNNNSHSTNSTSSSGANNILTTYVDMADGCSAFGMSVSATLRTLPLEQQELAKLRIQQTLYDIQFS